MRTTNIACGMTGCIAAILLGFACTAPLSAQTDEGLKFVPQKAMGFVHIRVDDILAGKMGKLFQNYLQSDNRETEHLREIQEMIGIKLTDLESVTIVAFPLLGGMENLEALRMMDRHGFSREVLVPVLLVTTKKPYDKNKILNLMVDDRGIHRSEISAQFLSDRTLLIGQPQGLVVYTNLIARQFPNAQGTLNSLMKKAGEKDQVIAGYQPDEDLKNIIMLQAGFGNPPILSSLYPLMAQPVGATLRVGSLSELDVTFYGKNPKSSMLAANAARILIKVSEKTLFLPPVFHKALASAKFSQTGNHSRVLVRLEMSNQQIQQLLEKSVVQLKKSRNRSESVVRLKQIGIALHNYHDTHKGFPPQAIKVGKAGNLSWRVAILPYIEQQQLYQQFHHDEPWDSPHNKKLIARMPEIYAPLNMKTKEKGMTLYQGFTGPDTVFENKKGQTTTGIHLVRIPDGTSNTLAVVEAAKPVIWTKPDDIEIDPKKPLPKLGGEFADGFHALFCDGHVQFIPRDYSAKMIRLMITRSDGQAIEFPDDRKFRNPPPNIKQPDFRGDEKKREEFKEEEREEIDLQKQLEQTRQALERERKARLVAEQAAAKERDRALYNEKKAKEQEVRALRQAKIAEAEALRARAEAEKARAEAINAKLQADRLRKLQEELKKKNKPMK